MSIRSVFVAVLLLSGALGCSARQGDAPSQGSSAIQINQRISDTRIVKILNNAEVIDLNKLNGGDAQDLLLRLYEIPVSGSCVPETHLTCAHEYYLAVSEYDEQPNQSLFHLGTVGEITGIEWMKATESGKAEIVLQVASYPELAFERHPGLRKATKEYRLEIHVAELRVISTR